MTIEHTEGDLSFTESGDANTYIAWANNNWLMSIRHNGEQLVEKQRANLRRMVATWNACQGITTESLEANGVAGFEHVIALTKQANDLRTVLLSIKLEWAALWAAMDALPEEWIPTTVAMYQHMLEIVPPRLDIGSRFLVGEPQRHNEQGKAVHACFRQVGKEYFARYMTVEQFKAM